MSINLIVFGCVGLAVLIGTYRRYARREAEQDSLATWAAWNGYGMQAPPAIGSTQVLRACEPPESAWYAVPVGPGGGALSILSHREDRDHHTDIAVVHSMLGAGFPRFAVHERHPSFRTPTDLGQHHIEFESSEFEERFCVTGSDSETSVTALHRLFTPELLVWWLDNADGLTVEYESGALVVACLAADGAYDLDTLVGLAGGIAARIVRAGDALVQA